MTKRNFLNLSGLVCGTVLLVGQLVLAQDGKPDQRADARDIRRDRRDSKQDRKDIKNAKNGVGAVSCILVMAAAGPPE